VVLVPQGGTEAEELTLAAGEVIEIGTFAFPPPNVEHPTTPPATTTNVDFMLPVHLVSKTTLGEATDAIALSLENYLQSRAPGADLTVDGLAAAIRDDSRFALVRKEVVVTVSTNGSFLQLTDGLGAYTPRENESLAKGDIGIDPREGAVPPPDGSA
jgi:hypothetical protein